MKLPLGLVVVELFIILLLSERKAVVSGGENVAAWCRRAPPRRAPQGRAVRLFATSPPWRRRGKALRATGATARPGPRLPSRAEEQPSESQHLIRIRYPVL